MGTTVKGMEVATPTSDHIAPGPAPALSNTPPLPPGPGPVPAPFLYIARSATADNTCDRLLVGGDPVLVVESGMAIEKPGNIFAKPCEPSFGADILTRQLNQRAAVGKGFPSLKAGGIDVAATTSLVYMNVPTDKGKTAQSMGQLWAGFALRIAASLGGAPGAIVVGIVDPVSIATGEVIDADTDLEVAGPIPLRWTRHLGSGRSGERTAFGFGGFSHAYEQWLEVVGDTVLLREPTGTVEMPLPDVNATFFHKALRLEVTRVGQETFEIRSLRTRLVRRFEPLAAGQKAVLRHVRDAWSQRVDLVYARQTLTRVTGAFGRELRIEHDEEGRIREVALWARGGPHKRARYAYDASGALARVEGAGGEIDTYEYDASLRLVRKTLPTGLSFRYAYDDRGRCVRAWGDGGLHEAKLEYDDEALTTHVSGHPEAASYTYDRRGAVVAVRSADKSRVQRIDYDEDLRVIATADAGGVRAEYAYDERGNLLRETSGGGQSVTYEYKDDLPVRRTDAAGRVTEYVHDDRGALVSVTYPSQNRLTLDHDADGRLTAIHGPDGALGAFRYDDEGNLVAEIGPAGDETRYGYDALGRIVKRTDALGRSIAYALDVQDRVTCVTATDGATIEYGYDALGREVSTKDALGHETRYSYVGTTSIAEHHLADGSTWSTRVDKAERVRQIVNGRGETWDFRYDRTGRIVEERTFDGRALRYAYSPWEQPSRVDRMDGTWRTFERTRQGQLCAERSSHGNIVLERDAEDRVTRAILQEAPGDVVVQHAYDALGRLVSEDQDGLVVRYKYDARGRVSERLLPTGHVTTFRYDARGLLDRVTHGGHTFEIAYDLKGSETRRAWAGRGTEIATSRDPLDRPCRVVVRAPPAGPRPDRTIAVDREYTYDARGFLASTEEAASGKTLYEHDAMGQLVRVLRDRDREERYAYDVAGSVIGAGPDADRDRWVVLPGNVLAQTADADFDHDEMRRRVRRTQRRDTGASQVTEYAWDCRDRLREVRFPDKSSVIYTYDAYGRRLRKDFYAPPGGPADPVRTVRFVWQGHSLAAEIDSDRGARIFVFGPGGHVPILQEQGGSVLAYVWDPIGTPTELVNENGEVVWRREATAWGKSDKPSPTPFRLLGQYADEETGFCYVHHRYFDPDTIRFLSPDPLGLAGGRNVASFNGSPVVHADPDGLRCALGNPAIDRPFLLIPQIPPKPGYYDVILHGYPDKTVFIDARGKQYVLSPEDLAKWIRAQQDYKGQPIRLISCNTGQEPNGFAKQFANQMGVKVEAPTGYAIPSTDPSNPLSVWHGVYDPSVPGGIRYTTPGTWKTFTPDPPASPPPAGPPAGGGTGPMPAAPSGGGTGAMPASPSGGGTSPMPAAGPGGTSKMPVVK